jgi:hypothetical protein
MQELEAALEETEQGLMRWRHDVETLKQEAAHGEDQVHKVGHLTTFILARRMHMCVL